MTRLLNSIPLLYLVMLWPSYAVLRGLVESGWHFGMMMHESGVWSVRFMVLSMSVTPFLLLLGRLGRGAVVGRWLLKRRRHFGIASFLYALMHVLHYVWDVEGSLRVMVREFFDIDYTVGWVGFFVLVALAATSNGWSMRRMGRNWKRLHWWIYPASALILLHWYLFEFFSDEVVFWTLLLLAIKGLHALLKHLPRASKA